LNKGDERGKLTEGEPLWNKLRVSFDRGETAILIIDTL